MICMIRERQERHGNGYDHHGNGISSEEMEQKVEFVRNPGSSFIGKKMCTKSVLSGTKENRGDEKEMGTFKNSYHK